MNNTAKIALEHLIVQSQGNIVSDMDGEKVMMNVQKGKYYNLGVVGGGIWEKIKSPTSVKDLITSLLKEYDIEYSECQNHVMDFLEMLYKEELIEVEVGVID
jgi:hypothetical protein